jgi:hypothetical protein
MNEELEQERSVLAFLDNRLVIVGHRAKVLHVLAVDDLLDLYIAGSWQRARVCSGGYQGYYYETESGLRGRFATSMRIRFISSKQEEVYSAEPVTTTLDVASGQITVAPDAQETALVGAGFHPVRRPVERLSFLHYSVSRFVVRFPGPSVSAFLIEQEMCA